MKKLKQLSIATHWMIHLITTLAGCGIGLISSQFGASVIMTISFILMTAGIVWHIVFVKCPYCGKHMNPRAGLPNYCPECGEKLE